MLSAVFSFICLISVLWSFFAGTTGEVASALLDGAGRAVEVTLTLMGVMSLWSGVMAVLREAGAIAKLSRILRPLMRLIFRHPCEEAVACLSANLLGIGNAATPLGIAALKKLQAGRETVTDDGIMLTVLCCSGASLVPTTVFALRRAAGATIMFELLPAIWAVGLLGTVISVALVKLLCRMTRRGGGR